MSGQRFKLHLIETEIETVPCDQEHLEALKSEDKDLGMLLTNNFRIERALEFS